MTEQQLTEAFAKLRDELTAINCGALVYPMASDVFATTPLLVRRLLGILKEPTP